MNYAWQPDTLRVIQEQIIEGTADEQSVKLGLTNYEPILVLMDSLIRYAKAYHRRFDEKLGNEYPLRHPFIQIAKHVRYLCNWDGAVAWEKSLTTDSKSNGVVEAMFWKAMDIAGLKEEDLDL